LLVVQGLVFASFRSLREHAVRTHGRIVARHQWRVRTKHGYTRHFAWDVSYDTPSGTVVETDEVNARVWDPNSVGTWVPVIYDGSRPSVMQIGKVGVSIDRVFPTFFGTVFLLGLYISVAAQRPWWRRHRVVDRVAGRL